MVASRQRCLACQLSAVKSLLRGETHDSRLFNMSIYDCPVLSKRIPIDSSNIYQGDDGRRASARQKRRGEKDRESFQAKWPLLRLLFPLAFSHTSTFCYHQTAFQRLGYLHIEDFELPFTYQGIHPSSRDAACSTSIYRPHPNQYPSQIRPKHLAFPGCKLSSQVSKTCINLSPTKQPNPALQGTVRKEPRPNHLLLPETGRRSYNQADPDNEDTITRSWGSSPDGPSFLLQVV